MKFAKVNQFLVFHNSENILKALAHLNKYFIKYKYRLILGLIFVITSNLFAVFPAQSVRIAIDLVQENLFLYQLYSGSGI